MGHPSADFPAVFFLLVFVVEHNWQIQVTKDSWVRQPIRGILSSTPAAKSPRARAESVIMEPLCPHHTAHCIAHLCILQMLYKDGEWVAMGLGHPVEWRDIKTAGVVLPTLYKVRRCDTRWISHVFYTSVKKTSAVTVYSKGGVTQPFIRSDNRQKVQLKQHRRC